MGAVGDTGRRVISRGERLTGFRSADLCVSTRVPDVCEHDDGIVVIRFRRHFLGALQLKQGRQDIFLGIDNGC